MSRELHNFESYIKQGKSLNEIYKSSLVSLSRSTIFERCKRYKEDSSFERKSGLGRKPSILMSIFNILNLIILIQDKPSFKLEKSYLKNLKI